MPTLPPLLVELKANASSITAAMTKAREEIEKTAKTTESASDRMAQVGKVAFIGLGAAATAFAGLAVKAALDGQQAHAQLVNAVQNSGTAFESVAGKVEETAGKFAKFGFTNEEVEAALTRMVTASGNTKTAMDNMGLAADLARARHISLEEASNALGKILAGNMRGMQAFGLSTKDASGHVLTTAAAVAELNQRFGGAAAANADTYAGKLQAMNAEWHNMVEAVGNMLLPVLADAAGAVANVVGWFEKHHQVTLGLAAVIGGPLVIAMDAYIAKQAVAFAMSTIETVKKIGTAIMTVLVPATEAEATAATAAATAEAFLTAGLSVAAGIAAVVAMRAIMHSSATKDVAASATDATGAVGGLSDGETQLGGETDTTTNSLKAQADLFKQLSGETNAQSDLVLKLIGDSNGLDAAYARLTESTGANSEVSKQAAQHDKDLAAAQKDLTDTAAKVTDALKKQSDAKKKLDDLMKPQTERNITDAADAHEAANDRLTRSAIGVKDKTRDLNVAISEYGPNSQEATLAQLDLNDALREQHDAMGAVSDTTQTMGDAQRQTIGTTDEIAGATSDWNDATKALTDAQGKQKDAQAALTTVLADSGAIKAAKDDTKNLADNTLNWQQATKSLDTDWAALQTTIADHPELRDQLVSQVTQMKDNLPKGADAKPLTDILTMLNQPIPPKSVMAAFFNPAPAGSGLAALTTVSVLGAITPISGALTSGVLGGLFAANTAGPVPPPAPAGPAYTLPAFRPPGAAEGAVVRATRGGKLMLVAEGGQDEAIIPLPSGAAALGNPGAGGAVTINIYGNGRDDTELAVAVRDELVRLGRSNGSTPGI